MGPLPGRRQGISGGLFAGVAPLWGRVQGRTRGAEAFAATGAEPRPRRIRPAAAVTTGIAATQPPVIRCCRCGWLRMSAPFSEPETVKGRSLPSVSRSRPGSSWRRPVAVRRSRTDREAADGAGMAQKVSHSHSCGPATPEWCGCSGTAPVDPLPYLAARARTPSSTAAVPAAVELSASSGHGLIRHQCRSC